MDINVVCTKSELLTTMDKIADDRSKAHFVIVKTKPLDAPDLVKNIGGSMSQIDKSHFITIIFNVIVKFGINKKARFFFRAFLFCLFNFRYQVI